MVVLKTLAPKDPGKYAIYINTDNSASQSVLETRTGHDLMLCACEREVWPYAAWNSPEVTINHKPGVELVLADMLSRMNHESAAESTALAILDKGRYTRVIPSFDVLLTPLLET